MSSNAPTPWQTTADEVLAVLLQDEKAHDRARFEWQVDERHFPPGAHREVFRAVDDLRLKNRPVHPAALHDACNGKVDVAWLGGLFMLYSEALTGECSGPTSRT
jgi:replicative DNA helicase